MHWDVIHMVSNNMACIDSQLDRHWTQCQWVFCLLLVWNIKHWSCPHQPQDKLVVSLYLHYLNNSRTSSVLWTYKLSSSLCSEWCCYLVITALWVISIQKGDLSDEFPFSIFVFVFFVFCVCVCVCHNTWFLEESCHALVSFSFFPLRNCFHLSESEKGRNL